jgi:hypothetical protein
VVFSADARPYLVACLSLGSIALGIEKKENAMDNIIETTEPLPDLEPAPDALFGGSESLNGPCDTASLWRMMQAGEVKHVRPAAILGATADYGTNAAFVRIYAPILASDVRRLLASRAEKIPSRALGR